MQRTTFQHRNISALNSNNPFPGRTPRTRRNYGRFFQNPDRDNPDLSGQVITVTGDNSGLGYETVRALGKHRPAHIYLAARSQEKAEAAIKQLRESSSQNCLVTFLELDLSSFASVKAAAKLFLSSESRLDILISNAGIMMTVEGLTKEGYEIQFRTNVMGPALFTQLLTPILEQTVKINPQARIANLSSASERLAPSDVYQFDELKTTMGNRPTAARYCTSKLADTRYTSALAERFPNVNCVRRPSRGIVRTNLAQAPTGVFFFFPEGFHLRVRAQILAAISPDVKTGTLYAPVGVSFRAVGGQPEPRATGEVVRVDSE